MARPMLARLAVVRTAQIAPAQKAAKTLLPGSGYAWSRFGPGRGNGGTGRNSGRRGPLATNRPSIAGAAAPPSAAAA